MIYLDYAAATPISSKALKAMEPYFAEQFFNPSAPYLPAKKVRADYESVKDRLAHTIGAKGVDLVITSGATESINLAFTAVPTSAPVLILATEHPAVVAAAAKHPVQEIKVDQTSYIDLADFKQKLSQDIQLVSISLANNEIGTIAPLAEIAEIIRVERANRLKNGNKTPIFLHSDASQALNLIDINVARMGVDLLTISAAKVYGPKGVGALYRGRGVELQPLTVGGGQEQGLRSGTENVPALMGFAAAVEEAKAHLASYRKKYTKLSAIFQQELTQYSIIAHFLGNVKHKLSNFCSVSFPGVDAERLIYRLEEQGVMVSTGAACAASKGEPSRTLAAIGLSDSEIAGSLRISFGKDNTEADVRTAAKLIRTAVEEELKRHEK